MGIRNHYGVHKISIRTPKTHLPILGRHERLLHVKEIHRVLVSPLAVLQVVRGGLKQL